MKNNDFNFYDILINLDCSNSYERVFQRIIKLFSKDSINHVFSCVYRDTENDEEARENFLYWSHKSFRSGDVSDNGDLDMLFWNFWHISDVPHIVLGKIFDILRKNNVSLLNGGVDEELYEKIKKDVLYE